MSLEKSTLSVVIPVWSGTEQLAEMAFKLAKQVKPMCEQLIVTEDSGNYHKNLAGIADVYLVHARLKHGFNLAEGLKFASMDFVAMIDSDISIDKGTLKDLCVPGKVVCPAMANRPGGRFEGCFFVAPRDIVNQLPPYDELQRPEGIDRWAKEFSEFTKDVFIFTDTVTYYHAWNQSYDYFVRQRQVLANEEASKRK